MSDTETDENGRNGIREEENDSKRTVRTKTKLKKKTQLISV